MRPHYKVDGLAPGQPVTLRASLRDDFDRRWISQATFLADAKGRVDVATQIPISGTYSVADPMGLLWSMQPDIPDDKPTFFANSMTYFVLITITAEIDNQTVATAYLERIRLRQDIQSVSLHDDELVGRFYAPNVSGPYAALLILGGSDGNVDTAKAALLASR